MLMTMILPANADYTEDEGLVQALFHPLQHQSGGDSLTIGSNILNYR
jgi:hypothetical protein